MSRIPETIGKYKIEALIAQGGMGAVYKAIHPTLNRPVIIKKLTLKGRKDITERFKREARILMDFRHDGIVNMYDHFKLGSSYYIILEFIDGKALDEVMKKQRYLDNGTTAYILYNTALALNYAHEKKVIHRDIKPANILLSKTGDIKLVDFGIAVSDEDSDEGLTREGMSLGTPGYMAPEQFHDTKNVDLRADIYSLGVLAYEMLTGKKPFPGSFTPELISNIQRGKYIHPRKFNPHIDPILLKIIRKSMNSRLEQRYKDLGPVIKELDRYLKRWNKTELSDTVSDLAEGKEPVKPKQRKKQRIVLKLIIAVIVVALFALTGLFCYVTGIYNGLLHPHNFGSVIFSVSVPGGIQPRNKIFIKTNIFHDDGKSIPEVLNRKIIFIKRGTGREDGSYLFRSFPVYVRQGAYRAKVEIEDTLTWYSFIVLSRNRQKLKYTTREGKIIKIDRRGTQQLITNVKINITNILTGQTISRGNSISLYRKGQWVDMEHAGPLITGGVYIFKIKNKLYFTKVFPLKIRTGQDNLEINAGLLPLPGSLSLTKEKKSIQFFLNGTDHVLSADAVPQSLSLNNSLHFKGNISPGKYILEILYRSKKLSVPLEIHIHKSTVVFVSIDDKTGKIKFSVH